MRRTPETLVLLATSVAGSGAEDRPEPLAGPVPDPALDVLGGDGGCGSLGMLPRRLYHVIDFARQLRYARAAWLVIAWRPRR